MMMDDDDDDDDDDDAVSLVVRDFCTDPLWPLPRTRRQALLPLTTRRLRICTM
jgi:hypothetical protein